MFYNFQFVTQSKLIFAHFNFLGNQSSPEKGLNDGCTLAFPAVRYLLFFPVFDFVGANGYSQLFTSGLWRAYEMKRSLIRAGLSAF